MRWGAAWIERRFIQPEEKDSGRVANDFWFLFGVDEGGRHRDDAPMKMGYILFVVAVWAGTSVSGDWTSFLGPHQQPRNDERGLNLDWSAEGPPLVWKRVGGSSYSMPVVAGERVIWFHRVGDEERVECVSLATGETQWQFVYPTAYVDRYGYNNGPRSAPLIHAERVYTFGAEGQLSCLELATGKMVWVRRLNDECKVAQHFFGVAQAPVIHDGVLLLNVGADGSVPGTGGVMGLEAKTGKTLWATGADPASYSTPVVRDVEGATRAFFLTRSGLQVVDPSSGRLIASTPFRSRKLESVNAASPVVWGNRVLVTQCYGAGTAVYALSGAQLAPVWEDKRVLGSHWCTPVLADGKVYSSSGRHESEAVTVCVDAETGRSQWVGPRGLGRSHLLHIQDRFMVLGERGMLTTIAVDSSAYKELSPRVRVIGTPAWAPPVVSQGRLFVRDDREIRCYDLRAKTPE